MVKAKPNNQLYNEKLTTNAISPKDNNGMSKANYSQDIVDVFDKKIKNKDNTRLLKLISNNKFDSSFLYDDK